MAIPSALQVYEAPPPPAIAGELPRIPQGPPGAEVPPPGGGGPGSPTPPLACIPLPPATSCVLPIGEMPPTPSSLLPFPPAASHPVAPPATSVSVPPLAQVPPGSSGPSDGTLPVTGLDVVVILAAGLAALGVGTALRRSAR